MARPRNGAAPLLIRWGGIAGTEMNPDESLREKGVVECFCFAIGREGEVCGQHLSVISRVWIA